MAAFDELRDFERPAWRRKLNALNTPAEQQAVLEEEAIQAFADKRYEKRMREIAKKYPGVPRG